ncbi:MAG: fibronectin type III domain-containing protein [Prolixibacteraceae bacterium]
MKKILLVCIVLMILIGCKKQVVKVAPSITSVPTTSSISGTTATIGGSISDDGGDPITARGVVYGLNPNPTISDNKTSDGTGIGTYSSTISGLLPGKTYYFRTYATNSIGTSYGDQITLSAPAVMSTITTTAATSITSTTATSGGNVTNDGGSSITAKGVCWGTATSPTIALATKTSDGTGTGTFTSSITGLTPGVTYYARAYATNSIGTSYGDQITIAALAVSPTVTTTAVSSITSTTATSGGSISSDGGAAISAKGVCWSTTTGPTIALATKTSDGTGTAAFTSSITGLSTNTTYYVRAFATNSIGTSYGSEISFKTSPGLPVLTTTAASTITTGSLVTGGNITADGGGTITARGVCWSSTTGPTIALSTKTSDGTGTGIFTSNVAGLSTNTLYYIRAYATNITGTTYGNEITAVTLSQDIKNIVPDNILAIISNLGMPMYTGKTPPAIENFYKLSPNALFNSNIPNDYAKGTTFYPVNFHFYNQNNTLLTIKLDYVEIGTNGGSGSGKEAFLSGSGNNFSAFMKVNYTQSGQTCDEIQIYSGTITSTGIKDLYYALFMVDDHGDPGNLWISNGQGRVFYDSDGLGSIIQSLSSKVFGNNLGIMAAPSSIKIK